MTTVNSAVSTAIPKTSTFNGTGNNDSSNKIRIDALKTNGHSVNNKTVMNIIIFTI